MGMADRAKHAAQKLTGKAKETTGRTTGDEKLEAEGQTDQDKAAFKSAGDKVKDAAEDVKKRL